MRHGLQGAVILGIALLVAYGSAQPSLPSSVSSIAPSPADSFNLTLVIGNLTARQNACSNYTLPRPYNNATYDTAFLGKYLSTVVGGVNYTYHRFGPFDGSGKNDTLVLLPGSRESSNIWTPDLLILLAYNREVVTVDLPGAGSEGPQSSDTYTLDGLAQSLLGFFKALNVTKPDVLGYSWGGTIALQLGASYGDQIGNLVLVSTTSGGEGYFPGEFITSNQSVSATSLNALLFPNNLDGLAGLCKLNAFQGIMPGPNLTSTELRNQTLVVNSAWSNNTLSDNLGNITNPTLLVAGQLDVIIDFQSTLYLLDQINSSVLLSTNAAGNGLLFQDTSDVGGVVTQFLDYYDGDAYDYDYVIG